MEPTKRVVIGAKYTGKREFQWDSRSGLYSESLPLLSYDERLLQAVLCAPQMVVRRSKDDIRQKETSCATHSARPSTFLPPSPGS
jgi:hypothetical protein